MHRMFKHIVLLAILFSCSAISFSQDKNNLWKGNQSYEDRQYDKAQESYQSSLELLPSDDATYNMANTLYKQQKYADAAKLFESVANQTEDKNFKAEAFHNLGNSYMKSKELDKGIEAYKNALRNNPNDEETRYNLSYALKMKQEEEKEDQDQDKNDDQDKDENQDKEENQDKQDQQKNEDEQDKDDQEQNQDKQDQQDQQDEEQQQEQQPQQNEISKEDAERLLENLENEEEKTQEKVQMKQRKSSNVKIENDW